MCSQAKFHAEQVHEELQVLRGNIRVICRVRPSAETSVLAFPLPGSITVAPPDRAIRDFEFNACFGPESSQVALCPWTSLLTLQVIA